MTLPLKHFKPEEFQCPCGCGKDYSYMKESILTLVDDIREKLGQPLIVTSSIRCIKHNKEVGGEPKSLHLKGIACDIAPLKKEHYEKLCSICEKLNPKGGIGIYPKNCFVHVDTRGTRARWLK